MRKQGLAAGSVMLMATLGGLLLSTPQCSVAQTPKHWLHAGAMPPGAIGSQRLLRGGPLHGYNQPVELRMPSGTSIAATGAHGETTARSESLKVGLLVGQLYRFRAEGVPGLEEVTVYPTVELIDRTYPPYGRETEFPIAIELTLQDLRLAAEGAFVTRVVYVEDPKTALPVSEKEAGGQQWFEARPGDDPLVLADQLGRPVAILRIGARDTGVLANGCYATPTPLASSTKDSALRQASAAD
ncbi:hypothetical protein [Botrimarina colliarenosi]|uniref:hypothetical protein n=1 Tax=Botrimarina colliarenosi TaxID=2528001 RepID=UPI0011B6912A|nr:hypothetical protein [Botrimarina colliarenosi]